MCEIKLCICTMVAISLLLAAISAHPIAGLLTDYTITPSSQVAYYHYPAPQRYQQLEETPRRLATYQQLQQQMAGANVQQQYYQPQQQQQQMSYQQQVSYQQPQQQQVSYQQPQQQQQQVSYQQTQSSPVSYQQRSYQQRSYQQRSYQESQQQYQQPSVSYQSQQQYQQQPSVSYQPKQLHNTAIAVQQFASPALENAAFSMALTSQGYVFSPPSSPSAAAAASASTLSTVASSPTSEEQSLNVKLPVPFGITPINAEPLPLQAGTPFDSLRQVSKITSYGTNHPLKRRR